MPNSSRNFDDQCDGKFSAADSFAIVLAIVPFFAFSSPRTSHLFTMSGIKIAVPTSSASSKASKDFLKVSIAASTYNVPVEWTKCKTVPSALSLISATDSRVKLENPKAKLTLSDSNAIVLYHFGFIFLMV